MDNAWAPEFDLQVQTGTENYVCGAIDLGAVSVLREAVDNRAQLEGVFLRHFACGLLRRLVSETAPRAGIVGIILPAAAGGQPGPDVSPSYPPLDLDLPDEIEEPVSRFPPRVVMGCKLAGRGASVSVRVDQLRSPFSTFGKLCIGNEYRGFRVEGRANTPDLFPSS